MTTSEYLSWDTAVSLTKKLYRDGKYRISLLVGCGIFFGLRISDLRRLRWSQILGEEFVLVEQKTSKRRTIKVNKEFQAHIRKCYVALGVKDENEYCFMSRQGGPMTIQVINHHLKSIKFDYRLKMGNFSSHSLRKTWARKIYENENENGRGEMALLKLSEMMNHTSPAITRRYIGLRQQELGEVYDGLTF